jgi:stage II sporulation protein M
MSWVIEEYKRFRKDYVKLFTFYYFIAITILILAFFFYKSDHNVVTAFHNEYMANSKDMGLYTTTGNGSWNEALLLFLTNFYNCLLILISGLIPVLVLPFLALYVNMVNTSMLLIFLQSHTGINPVRLFVYGMLPHGIFEISAIILSIVLGTKLSWNVLLKITRKGGEIKKRIKQSMLTYLRVIMPLLMIAALIESFITPYFLKMLKG